MRLAYSLLSIGLLVGSLSVEAAPGKTVSNAAARKKLKSSSQMKRATSSPQTVVPTASDGTTGAQPATLRAPTRIDFDDRLIQGQTYKSGAVYLYDGKVLKISTMIKRPENFRSEIVGTVYDS